MSIKIDFYSMNLELTEPIQSYIGKKVSRLEKHLKELEEARVDVTYNKTARVINERYITQITLRGPGFILRAEERCHELYPALDLVVNKIERQIERYKGKRYRSLSSARKSTTLILKDKSSKERSSESSLVARRKKFKLIPMDELEAIEQMNLLGHEDFFIFFNVKTNRVSVLYRRRDGSYGIIEPEMP